MLDRVSCFWWKELSTKNYIGHNRQNKTHSDLVRINSLPVLELRCSKFSEKFSANLKLANKVKKFKRILKDSKNRKYNFLNFNGNFSKKNRKKEKEFLSEFENLFLYNDQLFL